MGSYCSILKELGLGHNQGISIDRCALQGVLVRPSVIIVVGSGRASYTNETIDLDNAFATPPNCLPGMHSSILSLLENRKFIESLVVVGLSTTHRLLSSIFQISHLV